MIFSPLTVLAETIAVTIGELNAALESSEEEPDAVRRLVLDRIQARLDEAGLAFDEGKLVFEESLQNEIVEDGCNRTIVLHMLTQIRLSSDTHLRLTLDSLHDPITLNLELSADVSAVGRARQIVGFRLGSCVDVARDSFDFAAFGPLQLGLQLTLDLNPEFVSETTLRINPTLSIDSELQTWDPTIDVDDSILRVILERLLLSIVESTIGPEELQTELDSLQPTADELLQDALPDGYLDIELPSPDDQQIIALYELLAADSRFPLTLEYVRRHRNELLAALILDDSESLSTLLSNAAACQAGGLLQVSLAHEPIYSMTDGGCQVNNAEASAQLLFEDENCELPLNFVETSLNDFCDVALNSDQLGNAASDIDTLDSWTLSPGTRFDIGTLSIEDMLQPFSQRVNYKTVFTDRGECQLEMRIYTSHPTATGRTPVIALHGGSWQHRGSGFLGIETTATQFVNNGFIVFAPFYRLIGTSDGNAECNNSTIENILNDAEDALDWVLANGESYGAAGKPVLFGQSAGGHLAASLAVNRAEDISRAVLFYAPTDFHDFASQIQQGEYTGVSGIRILEAVTAQSVTEIDLESSLIQTNSFPDIIAANPAAYPPLFILHGEADDLLPFRQSTRLCNGLSGNPVEGPASLEPNSESKRRIFNCDDRGSQLHLITEGDHALDLCIAPELCLAGDTESQFVTADSLGQMLDWASAESLLAPLADDTQLSENNSSSGAIHWFFLWILMVFMGLRRYRCIRR